MGSNENEFAFKSSGAVMTGNGTSEDKTYCGTTAHIPPLAVPSIAAPQPRHSTVMHPLLQQYANSYYSTPTPQSNTTAGLSFTTPGVEGHLSYWKGGAAMGLKNGNIQNVEPAFNSGYKYLPGRCADKLEDDLRDVPLKKRLSNWTVAGVNANHGTNQEIQNVENQLTKHDSNSSNIRLDSRVVADDTLPDVSMLSAQTGGGEIDEEEMKSERKRIKHREAARKSRRRTKVLEAAAEQLSTEISELSSIIDFYSKESVKIERQNNTILDELRASCSPEEFAMLFAENPDQWSESLRKSSSSGDDGGYAF